MDFLRWIEQSGFSTWVRESGSVWAYPTILFFHTLGLGFVAGTSMAVDLRLLGFAKRMPIAPLERVYPVMWFGFWVNAVSGFILLAADATTKIISPIFYVKMSFITLAVVLLQLMRNGVFHNQSSVQTNLVSMKGKLMAAASLACWAGAITAGRLQAYLGPVSGAPGLTNHF